MKKSFKAESLAGIIVGVFILSFVLLGIGNLMLHSRDVVLSYRDAQKIEVLKNNIENVIKVIDTEEVNENEIFYVFKNSITKRFEVFTGTINAHYQYINEYGDLVDIDTYNGSIYTRTLWKQRGGRSLDLENQIIRVSIEKLIKQ